MRVSVFVFLLLLTIGAASVASAQNISLELVSHYSFGPSSDVVAHNGFLYAGTGCEVRIWDIRDESTIPELNWNNSIAKIYTKSLVKGLYVKDDYLYIAAEKHFVIADISDPFNPEVIGILDYPNSIGEFKDVEVEGDYAYLTGGISDKVYVVNVSDKANPYLKTTLTIEETRGLNISGNYLYVTTNTGYLYIVNISDPANPIVEGNWTSEIIQNASDKSLSDVAVKGSYAFVIWYHHGLFVLNISNPENPEGVSSIYEYPSETYNYNKIKIFGNYAYISVRYQGIDIIDISDPANIHLVGENNEFSSYAEGITVYHTGNIEFTFMSGYTDGIGIFNTTNVSNPCFVKKFCVLGEAWRTALKDNYIFLGARNDGVWVVNVSDPYKPKEVAFYYYPSTRAGGLKIQGNYLYYGACWGNLNIVNVSDPLNPNFVATDYGKATGLLLPDGDWLYGRSTVKGYVIYIYNISDPANPQLYYEYNGSPYLSRINDFAKYGEDYLLVADENGLVIINVSNKSNPYVVGNWSNHSVEAVDIYENYAMVVYHEYLKVIDLSNPTNPVEIGSLYLSGRTCEEVLILSSYAFVGAFDHIMIVNISDPSKPVLEDEIVLGGGRVQRDGLETDGIYLYASAGRYGVYILQIQGLPLTIYDLKITNIDQDRATITWRTNYEADSLVKYGLESGNYSWQVYDGTLTTSHSVTITDLQPNTTYYFVVNSTDASGNSTESQEQNFRTKEADLTPPSITIVNPVNNSELLGGTKSTEITIQTDEPAWCQYSFSDFVYGEGINFTYGQGETLHSFNLSLEDGRTYRLYYKCADEKGNANNQSAIHVFEVPASWWDEFGDVSLIEEKQATDVSNDQVKIKFPESKYNATKDTAICHIIGCEEGDYWKFSTGSCDRARALLEFTLPNQTGEIGSVKLWLYGYRSSSYDEHNVLDLYLLNGTFDEMQANWTHRNASEPWDNPGGDYSLLIDSLELKENESLSEKWINFTLKGSGAENSTNITWGSTVGLLLKMRYGAKHYRMEEFYSRESDYKPYLEIYPESMQGYIISKPITPTKITAWDKFYANYSLPENTSIEFSILDAETNETLCTGLTGNGDDISGVLSGVRSIKLKAELKTTNPPATPVLHDWAVTWICSHKVPKGQVCWLWPNGSIEYSAYPLELLDMYVKPSVEVIKVYDADYDASTNTWTVTVHSDISQAVSFNISTGLANQEFNIYRNGTLYATVTTTSDGWLNWTYTGGFSTYTFTFEPAEEEVKEDWITVEPTSISVEVAKGSTKTELIKIKNNMDIPITVTLGFSGINEDEVYVTYPKLVYLNYYQTKEVGIKFRGLKEGTYEGVLFVCANGCYRIPVTVKVTKYIPPIIIPTPKPAIPGFEVVAAVVAVTAVVALRMGRLKVRRRS